LNDIKKFSTFVVGILYSDAETTKKACSAR
jgi:hypothetical protein